MTGSPPGMTLTEIVITAVAFVIVFVAVLVLVLEMSRRRSERPGPFGPNDEEEYGGPPGYGRPPGYGPPPLWHDSSYDSRSDRR